MDLGAGCVGSVADSKADNRAAPLRTHRTRDALDGKPKFDLTKFDEDYFDRLRSRVSAAGEQGIYVSVMLFQGWSIETERLEPRMTKSWRGHPFNRANNINGVERRS